MKEKELRRLGRAELLELLLTQTKENERLQAELEKLQAELTDRRLKIDNAGSIAQAAMDLNGVFEAAQEAAQLYLENIALIEEETKQRCEKLLADAEAEAEQIRKTAAEADGTENSSTAEETEELFDKEFDHYYR